MPKDTSKKTQLSQAVRVQELQTILQSPILPQKEELMSELLKLLNSYNLRKLSKCET